MGSGQTGVADNPRQLLPSLPPNSLVTVQPDRIVMHSGLKEQATNVGKTLYSSAAKLSK